MVEINTAIILFPLISITGAKGPINPISAKFNQTIFRFKNFICLSIFEPEAGDFQVNFLKQLYVMNHAAAMEV